MSDKTPKEATPVLTSTDDKLDRIITYLHRMDRRDRMRMIGSSVHSVIWLVSTILVLYGLWYFTMHAPQMIQEATTRMMEQSLGGGSTSSNGGWMEQLQQYLQGQK